MKSYILLLLVLTIYSCKKETPPAIEKIELTEQWSTILGVSAVPYATADGVILKSKDGIRFASRDSGTVQWLVKQDNSLDLVHKNSFVHDGVFYSKPNVKDAFKAIHIATGTELYEYWQPGLPIDDFIRLTNEGKIRFSGSFFNTLAVFDLNADGTNLDTVFKVSVDGFSEVKGLDCYENERYYFVLLLARINVISNYSVNFFAIDKQTMQITRHVQGLSHAYKYNLKYHFLDLDYNNLHSVTAAVGTDVYTFNVTYPYLVSAPQQLAETCDITTYKRTAFSFGFNQREVVAFDGNSPYKKIACQWGYTNATISASKDYLFFPYKDATIAIYNRNTETQRTFNIDFISSQGVFTTVDTINQILYIASSDKIWAVPYEE